MSTSVSGVYSILMLLFRETPPPPTPFFLIVYRTPNFNVNIQINEDRYMYIVKTKDEVKWICLNKTLCHFVSKIKMILVLICNIIPGCKITKTTAIFAKRLSVSFVFCPLYIKSICILRLGNINLEKYMHKMQQTNMGRLDYRYWRLYFIVLLHAIRGVSFSCQLHWNSAIAE